MLEEYILTTDGEEYVDVNNVREALGIKEDENIFRAIEKLKEERERYKSNCDYFAGIAQDRLRDRNKLELELRQALGTVDEYADITGLVRKLKEERDNLKDNLRTTEHALEAVTEHELKNVKQERDELKDRLRTYRLIANGTYGDSCGYSGDKAPAFHCNVISYSWNFGPIAPYSLMDEPSYPLRNDSIRVELDLTPTANYKGAFDLEDLKKYIQDYGREKKLGVVESVDYHNAKVARAELAYLYKTVLGKEKLDRDLSPHEVMKAILDAVKKLRDAQFASDQCLRSVYMHVYEDTGYDISDIYAAPDKLADGIITRYNSARMSSRLVALSEIDDHIDELCDKYNVVQPDRKSTTKERIDYIFGVLAEQRDLANSNFNKAEGFRKEKRAVENVLAELRAKIREIYCSVVDDEWDEYRAYTSALNDINEEYKRVVHNFEERTADWSKERQELDRYMLAVGSLCNIPAEHRDDISWIEDAFNHTKKDYLKWQTQADKLARLRSNICTALCLGGETDDADILKRVRMTKECHDALCKDYTELRKAIWDAMDRKPETLPEDTSRLVGEVAELARGEKLLIEFRDAVAEAIGMDYPTTNQVILNGVQYIYKDRKDAYELVAKINDKVTELVKAKEDLQKDYDELGEAYSSVLKWNNSYAEVRRLLGVSADADADEMVDTLDQLVCERERCKRRYENWYSRYESEHTRANGEHKRAEKLRSDVTALKNHIELLKNANDSRANALVSLQAFKNECRKLKDEKTKVISAIGQDIWDDCLK